MYHHNRGNAGSCFSWRHNGLAGMPQTLRVWQRHRTLADERKAQRIGTWLWIKACLYREGRGALWEGVMGCGRQKEREQRPEMVSGDIRPEANVGNAGAQQAGQGLNIPN